MSGRVYKPLAEFWDNYEAKWSVSPDWIAQRIGVKQPVDRVTPMPHDTPKPDNHTRFMYTLDCYIYYVNCG